MKSRRRIVARPEESASYQSGLRAESGQAQGADVRFGSQADICSAKGHVRFTPNSGRKSGLRQTVMSALPPKADVCSAVAHVCYGPKADIRVGYAHFKINAMSAAKLP
jgi:hypothetical protein